MGLFSKDNRAAYRLGGAWEKLWDSPAAAAPHARGVRAVDAFHLVSDVANKHGGTSGDATVIAVEIVSAVDRHDSYEQAMRDLRKFYDRGDLRSVRDEPMDRVLAWSAVVEIAEFAARLARTYKVDGWRNEAVSRIGNGEHVDLAPLLELAPSAMAEAYRDWHGWLHQAEAMDKAEQDTYEDYEGSLLRNRRVVAALAPYYEQPSGNRD